MIAEISNGLNSAFNHYHHFHRFIKDGLIENMEEQRENLESALGDIEACGQSFARERAFWPRLLY